MNRRRIFIQAAEQISIQAPLSTQWMDEPVIFKEPFVKAQSPSFRDYIDAREVRRMSPIMKRALVTALSVIKETGISHPDAIITGTSIGSLDYTERFLDDLSENGEQALSPTYFMQSTHNTVSSALAIYTKTHGYNTTYSHGSISFDLTILDAWMQMQLGKISTALVGGYDEMVESYFELLRKTGYVGQPQMVPCGEVSMSMMLNTEAAQTDLCELAGIVICHKPSAGILKDRLMAMLDHADVSIDAISAVMTGVNGNPSNDSLYQRMLSDFFPDKPNLGYKHIFGENYTASALGVYAAAHMLKRQAEELHAVIVLNLTEAGDVSMILLKRI